MLSLEEYLSHFTQNIKDKRNRENFSKLIIEPLFPQTSPGQCNSLQEYNQRIIEESEEEEVENALSRLKEQTGKKRAIYLLI